MVAIDIKFNSLNNENLVTHFNDNYIHNCAKHKKVLLRLFNYIFITIKKLTFVYMRALTHVFSAIPQLICIKRSRCQSASSLTSLHFAFFSTSEDWKELIQSSFLTSNDSWKMRTASEGEVKQSKSLESCFWIRRIIKCSWHSNQI